MGDPLQRLVSIMQTLRSPERGCPWDRKQTFESLTPYTLEEVHEVILAIENKDSDALREELGDLLFQVVFYAQIANEQRLFDLVDVIDDLVAKMRGRHPHVFGDRKFDSEQELNEHWENMKKKEKPPVHGEQGLLAGVPVSLPALARSQKLQDRAARGGFDWKNVRRVREKLAEELDEFDQALEQSDSLNIRHEIGDLLTAIVNLARHTGVDAEQALRLANQRFENRFGLIEQVLREQDRDISDTSLDELEQLWQLAKKRLGQA